MNYYFDTSALAKRYIAETGSDTVDQLFESAMTIYTSHIAWIEIMALYRRLLHENQITPSIYQTLIEETSRDFSCFKIIPFNDEVQLSCEAILENYYIKTLDLIHLASAGLIKSKIKAIVLSDKKLGAHAINLGLPVENVLD
ncbi:MAG: type II toxin-antitoxin system VapC family toxin [Bacteroidota bacterium]